MFKRNTEVDLIIKRGKCNLCSYIQHRKNKNTSLGPTNFTRKGMQQEKDNNVELQSKIINIVSMALWFVS